MKTKLLPRKDIDIVVYITNDMYGGEWTDESVARWDTYVSLWLKHGPFYWIASGGLENSEGVTIAQSIVKAMRYQEDFMSPSVINKYLIGIDKDSVDTYTQIVGIKKIYDEFNDKRTLNTPEPKLFLVSDPFHLWGIQRIAKILNLKIFPISSTLSGGTTYKVKRLLTEVARFLISIRDPHFQSPSIKKRRLRIAAEAREKP